MNKALLVVDVQNYFVVDKAETLPQRIAWHIRESKYKHVLFAKFRNDPKSNFHTTLHFTDVTEPPATDLHEALLPYATPETTFEKTTYSAMKSEALLKYLKDNEITAIDLCGVSYDACVLATAFEAFDLGFEMQILDNLCSVSSVRDDLVPSAETIINRNLRPRDFRIKR